MILDGADMKGGLAAGKWHRCSPELLKKFPNGCSVFPRRTGDGTYSHDHFVSDQEEMLVQIDTLCSLDKEIVYSPAVVKGMVKWLFGKLNAYLNAEMNADHDIKRLLAIDKTEKIFELDNVQLVNLVEAGQRTCLNLILRDKELANAKTEVEKLQNVIRSLKVCAEQQT